MPEHSYECEKCGLVMTFDEPQTAPYEHLHYPADPDTGDLQSGDPDKIKPESLCSGRFYKQWRPHHAQFSGERYKGPILP